MFLGWIFNVLYLSFVEYHLPQKNQAPYLKFFLVLQTLVMAMMISFPLQGYGLYSIIFSTLHTFAAIGFIILFILRTKGQRSVSLWFARVALVFFFISTAGPFSLGYLMSNGLGQSHWYNFSIYYYLHFQYNGFFLFGIFSLFYQLLERKQITFNFKSALLFGRLMALACVLAYSLSILFAKPGLFFNATGAVAGVLQIIATIVFLRQLVSLRRQIRVHFHPLTYPLLKVVLLAFVVKVLLQLFSADPQIAQLAYALRPVVIAYLHLVLLGIITLFVMLWYVERGFVSESLALKSLSVLLIGFLGSEICLVMIPWWPGFLTTAITPAVAVFGFSVLLLMGGFLFYVAFLQRNHDKNHLPF